MALRRKWTREELVVALNLYFKLPFGQLHHRNPEIIRLAGLISRTPSAVAMRLSNYAAVDPYHINRGIKGLEGGKKQVLPIWEEFTHDREALLFESEQILARLEGRAVEDKFAHLLEDAAELEGREKTTLTRVRVNQHVFRQMVLANYDGQCAVTGINIPQLLVASHIVPWAANASERLNPANGLCLSPLYDKSFDAGLITFDAQYALKLSARLREASEEAFFEQHFGAYAGQPLRPPRKYLPAPAFLKWHEEEVFEGA